MSEAEDENYEKQDPKDIDMSSKTEDQRRRILRRNQKAKAVQDKVAQSQDKLVQSTALVRKHTRSRAG